MAGIDPYAAAPSKPNTSERITFDHPKTLTNTSVYISPQSLVYPEGTQTVSDKLYSGFIEHLGRGIYGGIVDDDQHPSPAEVLVKQDDGSELTKGRLGWRKDVMDIIGKEGDLEMPMLRWPGGESRRLTFTFTSTISPLSPPHSHYAFSPRHSTHPASRLAYPPAKHPSHSRLLSQETTSQIGTGKIA
jgi:hypothetical protein